MTLGSELETLAGTAADDGTADRLLARTVPVVVRARRRRLTLQLPAAAASVVALGVAVAVLPSWLDRPPAIVPAHGDITVLGCGQTLEGATPTSEGTALTSEPTVVTGAPTTLRLTYPAARTRPDVEPTTPLGESRIAGTAILADGVVVGRQAVREIDRDGTVTPSVTSLIGPFEVCSGSGDALPPGQYEVYAWELVFLFAADHTGTTVTTEFVDVAGPEALTITE